MTRLTHIVTIATCILIGAPAVQAGGINSIVIINNEPARNVQEQQLVSAVPYPDEVLVSPPASVTLTFTQPVHPGKSSIRVSDAFGQRLEQGAVSAQDKSISVALPQLAPGKYTVKWKAQCLCEQETELEDSYKFTVR